VPRFFAVAASVAKSSSAARLRAVRGPTMAFLATCRRRWLQTPCALRLGGPNPTPPPLTLPVASWTLARRFRLHVRAPRPSFVRLDDHPRCQAPCRLPPVRDAATNETGAPSAGSILDLAAEASALVFPGEGPLRGPRHPFARHVRPAPSGRAAIPRYRRPTSAPSRGPRWNEEDASRQHLQPTFDTSTRVIARMPSARRFTEVQRCSDPAGPVTSGEGG
jgi:hypothetical protein